jgi:hypothetical protein
LHDELGIYRNKTISNFECKHLYNHEVMNMPGTFLPSNLYEVLVPLTNDVIPSEGRTSSQAGQSSSGRDDTHEESLF